MKKFLQVVLLSLFATILLMGAYGEPDPVSAQQEEFVLNAGESVVVACAGDQLVLRPVDATHLRVACNQKQAAPTETPVAPTDIPPTDLPPTGVPPTDVPPTAVPPTAVPPTAVPPTSTPSTGPIQPFAGAPLCPSHDPYQWHGLWDYQRGCHYDHTHNADPSLGNAVFGPAAPWGTTISYPWATSAMENTHKHGGYKYAVRVNRPCDPNQRSNNNEDWANCVRSVRIEYHSIGHAMDALARFHSYYLEYEICKRPAFTECGILRTGGWADFGILEVPYKDHRVVRKGGQIDFGQGSTYGAENQRVVMDFAPDAAELNGQDVNEAPYVSLSSLKSKAFFDLFLQGDSGQQMEVWSAGDIAWQRYRHNRYAGFTFRIWDSWGLMDEVDSNVIHFFCRNGSCKYNASIHSMNELEAYVPANAFDPDGNGFADYTGYTDRYGVIVGGCSAPALDCVPFELVHVPVGYAYTIDPGNGSNAAVDFDISPGNARWLKFPN